MAEGGGDGGDAVTKTADWVQRLVVGKSLCPFAAEPLRKGEIKTVTWEGGEGRGEPLEVVKNEIESLLNEATKEKTTLVVFTDGCRFSKFEVLISFSYEVLEVINEAGLGDEVQIVTFHPEGKNSLYSADPEGVPYDFVTRSPYPTIHLLRTIDLIKANKMMQGEVDKIPNANIKRLDAEGFEQLKKEWRF